MERAHLVEQAEAYTELIRATLAIDAFYKISVEVSEGDYIFLLEEDKKSALSWKIILNPREHKDEYDIVYSVTEGLVNVLMHKVEMTPELKGVIAKITTCICNLMIGSDSEEDDEEEELGEQE